jgi:cytosine permease
MRATTPAASFTESVDDFSLARVPMTARQNTWDIALVRMGLTVSASDLVFGYTIGLYFSFWNAVLIALGYSIIVAVVSILIGLIGQREGTSFALSSRFAFGRDGSRLPSLILALVITGFYGYILGITVDVFPGRNALTELVYCLVLGLLFLAVAALGFDKGLKPVARFGVPLMIVLVLVANVATVAHVGGLGAIVGATPAQLGQMALPTIVGLGVAKWLTGAVVTPDIMRFGKNAWSVVTTTIAEFVVGNFGFNLLGLTLGLGLGASDLGKAFGLIGLTWLAVVAFLIQSFTVEMNELYAASLAVSNAAGVKRIVTTTVVGLLGIAIAYYGVSQGIIASFLVFIGYVSYAIPPMAGVMIADYYVVNRMRYGEGLDAMTAVNWRAVAAFVVSIGLSLYLGLALQDQLWHSLPVIGFVLYILFSVPETLRAWRAPAELRPAGEISS